MERVQLTDEALQDVDVELFQALADHFEVLNGVLLQIDETFHEQLVGEVVDVGVYFRGIIGQLFPDANQATEHIQTSASNHGQKHDGRVEFSMSQNNTCQAGVILAVGNDEVPEWDVVLVLDATLAQGEQHQIGEMKLGRGGNLHIPRDVFVFVGEITALESSIDWFEGDFGVELKIGSTVMFHRENN